jgi:hypothetical protein
MYVHSVKRYALLFGLGLMLAGCAGYMPLQRHQTMDIRKLDQMADVERKIGNASLQASHQFSVGNDYYFAKHYDLQIGMQQQVYFHCRPYWGCAPRVYHFPVTAPYVFIYHEPDGQVVAWGTLEELSKSPDDKVSDLMPALKASYDAYRKRQ